MNSDYLQPWLLITVSLLILAVPLAPSTASAESSPTARSTDVSFRYDDGPPMAPVVLVQSLTTSVGAGLWAGGGIIFALGGTFSERETMAILGLAMLVATPLTAAAIANTTATFMNRESHFLWTLGGSVVGGLGALMFGNLAAQFFSWPTVGAVALTSITAGTVGGYHMGRSRSLQAQRSLSLQPVHTPSLDVASPTTTTEVSGATLNWSVRF